MQYDLRLRCNFIKDGILVEFQKNINKIAPAVRTKSLIANAKLSNDEEELLIFAKQFGSNFPPFLIEKKFFSHLLFDKILNLNFFFLQKQNKSLKRIYTIPLQIGQNNFKKLKPKDIKIYIKSLKSHGAHVESYFEFDTIEVPIWYDFLIKQDNMLFEIDKTEIINKANAIVLDIDKTYFNYDELNKLKSAFSVLVQSKNDPPKSIIFNKSTDSFLSFAKNCDVNTDFYASLLEAYLKGKNYVVFEDKVLVIKESDINEKIALQIIQQSNIDNYDILEFLNKIKDIKQYSLNHILDILNIHIKTQLKPYQIEGVLWLSNLYKNKAWGGLLADDMGLGKTLQTISFLIANNIEKILIIAPASLVQNWKNEILKFTYIKENEIALNLQQNKIQILSYEATRNNISQLKTYQVLILDESQKIKNDNTQIFNAISQIKRDFTIILSGTPIENSLLDLWNMMSAITINFKWIYDNKIAPFAKQTQSAINLSIKFLKPFVKRREKEQVLNLPKRYDKTIFIDFSESEKASYDKIYNIFASALHSKLSARANFIMLEGLLRLRQFCSLHKIIPKSLCDCQNLKDSKLMVLLDLLEIITKNKEKVLIFSQFTKSLEVLKTALSHKNILYLDGKTSKSNRAKLIAKFQEKDSPFDVFLISLKAGGIGLNLTNAENAIILEPWFNPAIEEQAFSRIHRIGQEKQVRVYRLLYAESIESQIYALIHHKLDIAQGFNGELLKIAKKIFL